RDHAVPAVTGADVDLGLVEEFHVYGPRNENGGRLAPTPDMVTVRGGCGGYSAASGGGTAVLGVPAGVTETCTRPSARRWNATCPSTSAKMVWSRPRPTLLPGFHLVPRWRRMMLPATTSWPPDFLMPRRRPSVSRPLRDEPPAFLCAMSGAPLGGRDAGHAQHRDMLAVAVLAPAVLPAALLEDDDLVEPVLRDHRRGDRGARHGRGAQGQRALAADGEHVGEGDRGTRLGLQLLHLEHGVGGDAVLLSAGADHCEHRSASCIGPVQPHRRVEWSGRTQLGAAQDQPGGRGGRVIAPAPALSIGSRPPVADPPRPAYKPPPRRGDRVADCDGLENRCTCKRTVGSNPTLSARRPD